MAGARWRSSTPVRRRSTSSSAGAGPSSRAATTARCGRTGPTAAPRRGAGPDRLLQRHARLAGRDHAVARAGHGGTARQPRTGAERAARRPRGPRRVPRRDRMNGNPDTSRGVGTAGGITMKNSLLTFAAVLARRRGRRSRRQRAIARRDGRPGRRPRTRWLRSLRLRGGGRSDDGAGRPHPRRTCRPLHVDPAAASACRSSRSTAPWVGCRPTGARSC